MTLAIAPLLKPLVRPFISELLDGCRSKITSGATLAFHALTYDPVTYEMLGVKVGTGALTTTHASGNMVSDFENIWRTVAANDAVWSGARIVTNEVLHSENFENAVWVANDGGVVNSAQSITLTGAATAKVFQEVDARVSTDDLVIVSLQVSTADVGKVLRIGVGGTANQHSSDITVGAGGRVSYAFTWASTSQWVAIMNASTNPTNTFTDVSIQVEVANGRADTTTPSEYLPTTTATVTKAYANQNGNSVASNVVTEAIGAALTNMPKSRHLTAATNAFKHSNNLTDAIWVTTAGTPTVTFDQVGISGAPNTASKIIDGNASQYEGKQQSGTIADNNDIYTVKYTLNKDADTSRFPEFQLLLTGGTPQYIYLQLNTLTGASIVRGSVGTVSSEVLDHGDWWTVVLSVANNTSGNTTATGRFYPAITTTWNTAELTATGSIILGQGELHLAKEIKHVRGQAPIFTTTAAVSTDAILSEFDDANHSDTDGAYYVEWTPSTSTAEMSGNQQILSLNNAAGLLYYDATAGAIKSTDGTNTASVSLTVVANQMYKIAVAYDASNLNVAVDGVWGTSQPYDGAFASGTEMDHMLSVGYPMEDRNIRRYSGDYSTTKDQLDTVDFINYLTGDSFDDFLLDELGNKITI